MKHILFLATFLAAQAFAQTPLTISGEKLHAIFNSNKIFERITGSVESILYKGQVKGISTFAITTTESTFVRDNSGRVTASKQVPCLVLVEVAEKMDAGALATWEVSKVDFTACPHHK